MQFPVPFVVGVPRSGTTLLRLMLDAHPALAIPPETGFLFGLLEQEGTVALDEFHELVTHFPKDAPAWRDFGLDAEVFRRQLQQLAPFNVTEGIREFYRLYAARHGKPRYGDKTPTYCKQIDGIAKLIPEAAFVHIIRDGRDVALSLRSMWFAPGQDMKTLARYWSEMIGCARKAGVRKAAYMEVRFESLVGSPQAELRRICRFLQLPYDDGMLHYWQRAPERLGEHRSRRRPDGTEVVSHEQRLLQQQLTMQPPCEQRISAWKQQMTKDQRGEFAKHAGGMLEQLGYEV